MGYNINTIYDMQNEIDYLNHCNEFVHNLDFDILIIKNVGALSVYDVLNNNVYLYMIYYYKFLLLVYSFD